MLPKTDAKLHLRTWWNLRDCVVVLWHQEGAPEEARIATVVLDNHSSIFLMYLLTLAD